MFRRRFFPRALLAIILLIVIAFGGYALYQAGVGQGYALGLAAEGVEGAAPPLVVPRYGYGFGFLPFFWGLGIIFKIGFFLLLILLISRLLFRPWGFGRRGWGRGPWGHKFSPEKVAAMKEYWKKHHGEVPRWFKDWEEDDEGEAAEVENDKDA